MRLRLKHLCVDSSNVPVSNYRRLSPEMRVPRDWIDSRMCVCVFFDSFNHSFCIKKMGKEEHDDIGQI